MENTEIQNPESGTRNRNWRNEWMIQVGKYHWHQNSSSLLYIPRKMDDDMRSPLEKKHEYKEHSTGSYHSFQLNWVWDDARIMKNMFAFVCRSGQTTWELVEMWVCEYVWKFEFVMGVTTQSNELTSDK